MFLWVIFKVIPESLQRSSTSSIRSTSSEMFLNWLQRPAASYSATYPEMMTVSKTQNELISSQLFSFPNQYEVMYYSENIFLKLRSRSFDELLIGQKALRFNSIGNVAINRFLGFCRWLTIKHETYTF